MADDELSKRRRRKPPKLTNENVRKAIKAVQTCPTKGCNKKNGHWGKCK